MVTLTSSQSQSMISLVFYKKKLFNYDEKVTNLLTYIKTGYDNLIKLNDKSLAFSLNETKTNPLDNFSN